MEPTSTAKHHNGFLLRLLNMRRFFRDLKCSPNMGTAPFVITGRHDFVEQPFFCPSSNVK